MVTNTATLHVTSDKGMEPSEVYDSAPKVSKEMEAEVKFDVTSFQDVTTEYMKLTESEKADLFPETGLTKQDLQDQHKNEGEKDLEIDAKLPDVSAESRVIEEKLSANTEQPSVFNDDTYDFDDDFHYHPTRVSYKYAANYTINGNNLRRKPLATFGKWGARKETKPENHKKSSGTAESRTNTKKPRNTRRYILALLWLTIFVATLCYYSKDGGGVAKVFTQVGGDNIVAMVTSQWNKMVALLPGAEHPVPKKSAGTKKKTKKKKKKKTNQA